MDDEGEPQLFANRWADTIGEGGVGSGHDRCTCVARSQVSRPCSARYGNHKYRPAFPALSSGPVADDSVDLRNVDPGVWGATAIRTCSVCDQPVDARNHYVQAPHTAYRGPGPAGPVAEQGHAACRHTDGCV